MLNLFSYVWLFATPWTLAHQAPLSMGFSRQEHWSGLLFPSPEDLPEPEIEPTSLTSPALEGTFLTTSATWETPIPQCLLGIGSRTCCRYQNPQMLTSCDLGIGILGSTRWIQPTSDHKQHGIWVWLNLLMLSPQIWQADSTKAGCQTYFLLIFLHPASLPPFFSPCIPFSLSSSLPSFFPSFLNWIFLFPREKFWSLKQETNNTESELKVFFF